MIWRKELGKSQVHSIDVIIVSVAILFVVGLMTKQLIVFAVAAILTAHLILFKLFDRMTSKNITINNPKRSIRLFPGEEVSLSVEVKNETIFPLINGEVTWTMGRPVSIVEKDRDGSVSQFASISASLAPMKKVSIQVPIRGVRRGATGINHVAYHFSHLFNFHSVSLYFQPRFETEFIVYPELKRVEGVEIVFHMYPGSARLQYSPFEDNQDLIGTRDYTSSDSFQRINWKASVRAQQLQTNVYQRVVDRSFLFLVNLRTELKRGSLDEVEHLLSYTAYLCQYAAEEDVGYEMMLNVLRPGKVPYLQQHEGSGRAQLAKSLEMLAYIPRHPATHPFEKLLYDVAEKYKVPKTIVIVGTISPETYPQLARLKALGHHIFYVEKDDEIAYVNRLTLGKIA